MENVQKFNLRRIKDFTNTIFKACNYFKVNFKLSEILLDTII